MGGSTLNPPKVQGEGEKYRDQTATLSDPSSSNFLETSYFIVLATQNQTNAHICMWRVVNVGGALLQLSSSWFRVSSFVWFLEFQILPGNLKTIPPKTLHHKSHIFLLAVKC